METIEVMTKEIKGLHDTAYAQYCVLAEDICNRNASEAEVACFLDDLIVFCGDDKCLKLFKQVCRYYYFKYPEEITFQVNTYFEWYEGNEE